MVANAFIYDRPTVMFGTDDITCGKAVMAELAKVMGDKGTIAILAGNQSAPNLQARVAEPGARARHCWHVLPPPLILLLDGADGEPGDEAVEEEVAVHVPAEAPRFSGVLVLGSVRDAESSGAVPLVSRRGRGSRYWHRRARRKSGPTWRSSSNPSSRPTARPRASSSGRDFSPALGSCTTRGSRWSRRSSPPPTTRRCTRSWARCTSARVSASRPPARTRGPSSSWTRAGPPRRLRAQGSGLPQPGPSFSRPGRACYSRPA